VSTFLLQLKAAKIEPPVSEYRFAPPRRWRFDLAWPAHMTALEIEGGIWKYGRHNRPGGFLRDAEKYNEAAILGWKVIRVTHQQLNDGTALKWLERVLPRTPREVTPTSD
jgi:hypothetical protein